MSDRWRRITRRASVSPHIVAKRKPLYLNSTHVTDSPKKDKSISTGGAEASSVCVLFGTDGCGWSHVIYRGFILDVNRRRQSDHRSYRYAAVRAMTTRETQLWHMGWGTARGGYVEGDTDPQTQLYFLGRDWHHNGRQDHPRTTLILAHGMKNCLHVTYDFLSATLESFVSNLKWR